MKRLFNLNSNNSRAAILAASLAATNPVLAETKTGVDNVVNCDSLTSLSAFNEAGCNTGHIAQADIKKYGNPDRFLASTYEGRNAQIEEKNKLPKLDIPGDTTQGLEIPADLKASSNSLGLSTTDGLTGIEYSEQYGIIINVGMQITSEDGTKSLVFQGAAGEKEKRVLIGAGFKVGKNGVWMLMLDHLRQQKDFDGEDFQAVQNKLGVKFAINGWELGASFSKSKDVGLHDTRVVVDTETAYQLFSEGNKYVGQNIVSLDAAKTYNLSEFETLKATLGGSSVDGGKTTLDGALKYTLYLQENGKVFVEIAQKAGVDIFRGGYERNLGNGYTGELVAENVDGDNRIMFYIKKVFGNVKNKVYKKPTTNSNPELAQLLIDYLRENKSVVVAGEVKQTGRTLLLEIDKTGAPANIEINDATGNITVSGLNSFTAFTSVTKDGTPIANTAFDANGTSMLIKSMNLEPGTYVLTTNGNPAQTITIVVANGSIIIKSITIDTVDGETTITSPTLDSKSDTTVNTTVGTFEDDDDVRNVRVEAYLDAGLTNKVAEAVNGDFILLTPNTLHYFATVGEAYNASTGEWEEKKSGALEVTTNEANTQSSINLSETSHTNNSITVNFSGNDLDGDKSFVLKLNGTVVENLGDELTNGTYTFTNLNPETSYDITFEFMSYDPASMSWNIESETKSITTSANPNIAPTANNDSTTTAYNTSVLVDVLGNDTDAEGAVSLTGVITNQVGGTFVVENGQIRFTPTNGFTGTASATYEITDTGGLKDTASVAVNVLEQQVPPVISTITDQVVTNGGGLSISVSDYTTQTNGDSILSYNLTFGALPVGITLNSSTGDFEGTTTATGEYTIAVTATDNDGESDFVKFKITVNAVPNTNPTANNFTVSNIGNSVSTVNWKTLSSANDADGDTLTATMKTQGAKGTCSISGTDLIYTPNAGVEGSDTCVFTISDGIGVKVDVTATFEGIDTIDPVATFTSFSLDQDGTYNGTLTATDVNTVTFAVDSGASHGTLNVNANGSFTYTPTPGYSGTDSFAYSATDTAGNSDIQTVSVTVDVVNTAPTASDVTQNVSGETITYDLTPNISDSETADSNLTVIVVSGPSHGGLVWNTNSEFTYTVTQGSFYFGNDSFTYKVKDPQGLESDTKTVTLTNIVDF